MTLIHVLQRVGSLYRQLAGVHHGQGALLRVQPGLLAGRVLPFPLRVVLSRLVHTLHHLWEGRRSQSESRRAPERGSLHTFVLPVNTAEDKAPRRILGGRCVWTHEKSNNLQLWHGQRKKKKECCTTEPERHYLHGEVFQTTSAHYLYLYCFNWDKSDLQLRITLSSFCVLAASELLL